MLLLFLLPGGSRLVVNGERRGDDVDVGSRFAVVCGDYSRVPTDADANPGTAGGFPSAIVGAGTDNVSVPGRDDNNDDNYDDVDGGGQGL